MFFIGDIAKKISGLPPNPLPKEGGDEEVILHAGNIFDHQNPKHFWQTIKSEIDKGRKLKMVFIGTVSPEIRQSIKNSGLDPYTEYKGFLPYKEMLKRNDERNLSPGLCNRTSPCSR